MTKTEAALRALKELISEAAQQPGATIVLPTRNRDVARVLDDLGSGSSVALNLRDGEAEITDEAIGDSESQYDLEHTAELEWAVSDTDDDRRDATFDDGLTDIAAAIRAANSPANTDENGFRLDGTVSSVRIARIVRSSLVADGAPQLKACVLEIVLIFSSPEPF